MKNYMKQLVIAAFIATTPPLALATEPLDGGDRPLLIEGKHSLYQRVLATPDARLAAEPGGEGHTAVTPFTSFYVYARREQGGTEWVEVGTDLHGTRQRGKTGAGMAKSLAVHLNVGGAERQLITLLKAYDTAIDLFMQAAELEETAGLDNAILLLSRRTAKVRATLAWREQARTQEGGAKPTPPAPTPAPAPGEDEPSRAGGLPELIGETKAERVRGIQGARTFLVRQYYNPRHRRNLLGKCHKCEGRKSVPTSGGPDKPYVWERCPVCHGKGLGIHLYSAAKSLWMTWSPLYRMDEKKRAEWKATVQRWRSDARTLPEPLTGLRILEVDYHGLWADLTWVEKGVDGQRTVTRRVIRAGRRWFFYSEAHDRDFFGGEAK